MAWFQRGSATRCLIKVATLPQWPPSVHIRSEIGDDFGTHACRGCPRDSRWGSDLATTLANPKHTLSSSEIIPRWILKRGKVRYPAETSSFSLQSDETQTED